MKLLVEYKETFGYVYDLSGVFICEQSELQQMKDKGSVYLGEALGKHSQVTATLSDDTLTVKTDDQEFINRLSEILKVERHYIGGTDVLGPFLDQLADDTL